MNSKKILYIHHGDHRGGAPMSLLYTAIEVKKIGFEVVVGLVSPSPQLHNLYNSEGIETIEMPWLNMLFFWSASRMQWWKPSTYSIIFKIIFSQKDADSKTLSILNLHKIDIIHLNSVSFITIIPFLKRHSLPFVWHIREHAPTQNSPLLNYVRRVMLTCENIIFLSHTEQKSWLKHNEHGTVVYNFVNTDKFNSKHDEVLLRNKLGLQSDDRVILYLGGIKPHKGVEVLIESLHILKPKFPNLKCLMPDSLVEKDYVYQDTWMKRLFNFITGRVPLAKRVDLKIHTYNLNEVCIRLPFDSDSSKFYFVSDFVVFPATEPHFARPIIEASMMKKPSIVSNWDVLKEIILPNLSRLTAVPGHPNDLANKIEYLLNHQAEAKELGVEAYKDAIKRFTPDAQIPKIIKLYQQILSTGEK